MRVGLAFGAVVSFCLSFGCATSGIIDPPDEDGGGTTQPTDGGAKADGMTVPVDGGCPMGQKACSGICTDVVTDPKNCGGCGKTCPDPEGGTASCMSGTCGGMCMAPKVLCPDGCTDTKVDPNNCGMCGTVCMMGETCSSGICCATGQTNCSGMCADLQSDDNNCNMCGNKCGMGLSCVAGMCTNSPPVKVGNYTVFNTASSHAANYLLGSPLAVPKNGKLLKFGVISKSSGPKIIMALYTDVNGNPGNLVAYTSSTTCTNSDQQINPNVMANLTQGNYWIMGEFDVSGSVGIDYSNSSAQVKYITHTFGTSLPSPFGNPQSYTGQRFNYYIVMQ